MEAVLADRLARNSNQGKGGSSSPSRDQSSSVSFSRRSTATIDSDSIEVDWHPPSAHTTQRSESSPCSEGTGHGASPGPSQQNCSPN